MDLRGIKEEDVNWIHLYGTKGSLFDEYWNFIVLVYEIVYYDAFFFPLALQPQLGPWPTYMKLFVSLRFTRT
jgi:hypothetical protein